MTCRSQSLRRRIPAALIVVAAATVTTGVAARQGGQTLARFRLVTDGVLVDVGATSRGRPIEGLTAADFELTDNGVRQTIDLVAQEMLPLDVTLLVDTSAMAGSIQDQMRADVAAIASRLRPDDAVRLVTFGGTLTLSMPLQPVGAPIALEAGAAKCATALNDALLYALLQPTARDRRHAILAMTPGLDTWSWLESSRVADIARRSDALLSMSVAGRHPVFDEAERMLAVLNPQDEDLAGFMRQLERTLGTFSLEPYVAAARATGGDVFERPPGTEVVNAFGQLIDSIRMRYVIGYVPRGVKRDGWHKLTVKLPKVKGAEIRAREGYSAAQSAEQ